MSEQNVQNEQFILNTKKPLSMSLSELKTEIDGIKGFKKAVKEKTVTCSKVDLANIEIRLSKLEQAQKQKTIENRLREAKRSNSETERKRRTHRLAEVAGTLEIYFGKLDLDDSFNLLRFLLEQDERGGYASKALGREYDPEKIAKAKTRMEELKKKAAEKRARQEQERKERSAKALAAKAAKKAAEAKLTNDIDVSKMSVDELKQMYDKDQTDY